MLPYWRLENGVNFMRLEKEFYKVKELAELLQVNKMLIYKLVEEGKILCHHIGRNMRFRREDIEVFLKACRSPEPKPDKPPTGGSR